MFIVFVLLLLSAAVLFWMGTLSWPPALLLLAIGATGLLYFAFRRISLELFVSRETHRLRASWSSAFRHMGGLPVQENQDVFLYLLEDGNLAILTGQLELHLQPQRILRLLVLRGEQIETLSDATIQQFLQTKNTRAMNLIRETIRRNRRFRHRKVLLMSILAESAPDIKLGELIVLVHTLGAKDLKNLLKKPDFRVKARTYSRT